MIPELLVRYLSCKKFLIPIPVEFCIFSMLQFHFIQFTACHLLNLLRYVSDCYAVIFVIVSEAEYMYRLRKDIIPLVLEPGYVPDGWLGILIGTKLFFDISRPATFDVELERLIQEIGSRGRLALSLDAVTSTSAQNSACLHCQ